MSDKEYSFEEEVDKMRKGYEGRVGMTIAALSVKLSKLRLASKQIRELEDDVEHTLNLIKKKRPRRIALGAPALAFGECYAENPFHEAEKAAKKAKTEEISE